MGLYIEDAPFVAQLEQQIFEADLPLCRELQLSDLESRLQELGGWRSLNAAQFQARLT